MRTAIITPATRALSAALVVLVLAVLGAGPSAALTTAQATDTTRLEIVDARLTGDGPWTSWFGGAAERRLLLVIENTGSIAIADAGLQLRSGKGEATTPIAAPPVTDLAPGERRTIQVDVDLDPFAFGTHAVVGEFTGLDDTVRFRAETTHVPWALLLLPTIVLAQVTLVALRNRARRRLAPAPDPVPAPPETPDEIDLREPPTEPRPPALDLDDEEVRRVVERELDNALGDLRDHLGSDGLVAALERRAGVATDRVARRLDLAPAARAPLAAEITRALLARIDATHPVRG